MGEVAARQTGPNRALRRCGADALQVSAAGLPAAVGDAFGDLFNDWMKRHVLPSIAASSPATSLAPVIAYTLTGVPWIQNRF